MQAAQHRYTDDMRPAYQPWQQSAPMGQAVEAWRMRSAGSFAALAEEQGAKARSAGLVSVSTTCTKSVVDADGVVHRSSALMDAAENCITIDPAQSRVTRLRKGLGIAAKQLHNMGSKRQQIWMQTLTYAGTNRQWRPEHISRYLDAMRRWHYSRTKSRKLRYAWVAELQDRGVIHYHVIVWLEAGLTPPKGDMPWKTLDRKGERVWHAPMWPHGMTRRDKSRSPVAYLMSYVSKVESKNIGRFPHGARIHGAGGMDATGRAIRRWVLWPAYVQGNAAVSDRFRPAAGGGYVNLEFGPARPLLAEFAPTGGGFKTFRRVRETPRAIDAVGPFSWAPDFSASRAPAAALVH